MPLLQPDFSPDFFDQRLSRLFSLSRPQLTCALSSFVSDHSSVFRARPGTADLFGLTGVAGVVEAAPANSVTVQVSATFPIGASESVLRATLQRFKDAGCHIIIMFTSRSGTAGQMQGNHIRRQ